MKCDLCEIAKKKIKAEIIYEDKDILAVVKDMAATPGQVCIFPKQHSTIMELVPNRLINHIFKIANKLGIAVFESLGVQGTNIVVQNGTAAGQKVPHFCVNIIPRKEGDNLNLQWQPKQLMEDEIETPFLALKEEGDQLVLEETESKEEVLTDGKTEVTVEKEDEDNYLIKQLRRIP